MRNMREIHENVVIDSWVRHFLRSPKQINKPHESDVELINISDESDFVLATTVDTVAEEIRVGLYREAYTMGWIAVVASLSDLAAVGADPLGLLVSVTIDENRDRLKVDEIARGMEEACRFHSTFILGGDTNIAPEISLTSCAFGLVHRSRYMARIGCKPGDIIFATGRMGSGNALGFVRLTGCPPEMFPEENYRPIAHLKEGRLISKYATCCMDTSDGLLATLDQLMRLNGVGFLIECDWERLLSASVLTLCSKTQTPQWAMLAGPHGEFQLVFSVSPEKIADLTASAKQKKINLIRVGEVQQPERITLRLSSKKKVDIDVALIRNLLQAVRGDLSVYVKEFLALGRNWNLK